MPNTRSIRTYDQTFREDALAYLERSKSTFQQAADSLGIPTNTLYSWHRSAMARKTKKTPSTGKAREGRAPETDAEKLARLEEENQELRKQMAALEEDKVILKKFAAFSVREKT